MSIGTLKLGKGTTWKPRGRMKNQFKTTVGSGLSWIDSHVVASSLASHGDKPLVTKRLLAYHEGQA